MLTPGTIPPREDGLGDVLPAPLISGLADELDGVGKAEFGHIYNHVDPGPYYRTLGAYDYRVPEYGAAVVDRMLQARAGGQDDEERLTVLDVCCSYGVGGTLLTTDLGLGDLYDHYRDAERRGLTGEALVLADRQLLAGHRKTGAARVIGLDSAETAVNFGMRTGAMDNGIIADLEQCEPPPDLGDTIGDVEVVMCTGGVGYITERTFERLLGVLTGPPWFAVFCLRTFDYGPIAGVLGDHGLRTERAQQVFPQRRFVDDAERDWAIAEVVARGLDPAGMEAQGMYYAELYISRSPEDIHRCPLEELVPSIW